jgi:Holliday junction DNA helicase RuvA
VVLELQDKMAALALTASGQPSLMMPADEQVMRDVISALLNLGYRQQEAERAVRATRAKQDGDLTLEALLKDALQVLAR